MPTLKLTIDMGNDAFQDYPENEVAKIFAQAFEKINWTNLDDTANLFDSNGNKVGKISITP